MDRERMVETSMREMARAFHDAHETLEETLGAARSIVQTVGQGALLGLTGEEYLVALQTGLIPRVVRLEDKLMELESDGRSALVRIRAAEDRAQGRFQ